MGPSTPIEESIPVGLGRGKRGPPRAAAMMSGPQSGLGGGNNLEHAVDRVRAAPVPYLLDQLMQFWQPF
jgi:hypothetical protein